MNNRDLINQNSERLSQLVELLKTKKISDETTTGKYSVKVIDYDGTVLKEKHLNEGDTFTLPDSPSHEGLVFQEWSCSQEIVDNTITIADSNVMVGAVYTTESGLNEFDIELTKVTGLDVTLKLDGTKDWGDGTSDDLTTHTYATYGKYTIKCNGTVLSIDMFSGIFGQMYGAENYYCTNIRLISNLDFSTAFNYCKSLKSIIIPNGITSMDYSAFAACNSLESIVIPGSVVTVNSNLFSSCYSLRTVVMPIKLTNMSSNVFTDCYSVKDIVIPANVTTSNTSNLFYNSYSLTNIKLPNGITTIASNMFQNCDSLTIYDFSRATAVIALGNTNAFTNINKIAKIIVPDELYDSWIVATNWATYADYIYKASEVNV